MSSCPECGRAVPCNCFSGCVYAKPTQTLGNPNHYALMLERSLENWKGESTVAVDRQLLAETAATLRGMSKPA